MIRNENEVPIQAMTGEGIVGVDKRILIGPADGYNAFLRVFTVQPGGHTPRHSHPWYHANYILEGEGVLTIAGEARQIKRGDVAFIKAGIEHNFAATGTIPLKFICLVPPEGDKY